MPVKSTAWYQQDMCIVQKISCKFLIVRNSEFSYVQPRENVKGGIIFHKRYPVYLLKFPYSCFPLFIKTPARPYHGGRCLHILKRRRDCHLRQCIGTKPHRSHLDDSFPVFVRQCSWSAKHHPSAPVTAQTMRFGKAVHRNHRHIFCQGCRGHMLFSIHHQAIIDLIRKNHQSVFSCHLDDLKQDLLLIQHSRWVIGIDNNDGFRPCSNFLFNVRKIRRPAGFLYMR